MKANIHFMAVAFAFALSVHGQGAFQNLDFESANLPIIPSGQYGGFVSSTDAIPGWSAYYGINQTTQILQNNYSLGAVNISIFGPNWSNFPILQGGNSLLLQSGLDSLMTTRTPASIAQTATIPTSARSLQFIGWQLLGDPSAVLEVSLGGQSLTLVSLSIAGNYTTYGADISALAGLTRELRLASMPSAGSPYNSFLIDSVRFSGQAIPEATAVGIFGLGAMLLGWRLRNHSSV